LLTRRQILGRAAALAFAPLLPITARSSAAALRGYETQMGEASAAGPIFRTSDARLQSRYNAAVDALPGNKGRVFKFSAPVLKEGARYAGVWLECGPHEGLVYSPFDLDVAINNHRVFFDLQRDDGCIPCAVRIDRIEFSQIQMVVPIAATALELFHGTQDEDFLQRAYRSASAWDAWLMRYRNTRSTGLCEAFCGYDTGEDNSARFRGLPWMCPDRDARICPKVGALPYLAPDLSATVYGGRRALARMARILGKHNESANWEESAEKIRQAIMKWCFDPAEVCFYDVDVNGQFVRIRCVELIVVLGEHVVSQDLFDSIYLRHIHNPKEFWTPFPFPSVAVDDPAFNHEMPDNCWGGPSQVLTALRAPRWMEHYGKSADLTHLMRQWVNAITRSSEFEQQVNPWTGAFSTGSAYSPCMLLLLDFVARLYGVKQEGDALQWSCRLPEGASDSFFALPTSRGTAELSIRKSGAASVSDLTLAGRNILSLSGVCRVNTDAAGKPTSLLGTEPAPSRVALSWPDGREETRTVAPDQKIQL